MSLFRGTAVRRTVRRGVGAVAVAVGLSALAVAVSPPQDSVRTEALTYGVNVREIFVLKVDVR
ncbi:hypothetical protein ACIQRS_15800 [Streptomyces termitum]|uniref:Uncharacterized protein n=1 Tax=Streptomyces termitum TaxID=67368 RepID=A0A918T8H5_9ACTN|nr:hypothetical protein [Streptomyces termitum]GHB09792.1 hypothetical protein GCM10010305_60810 [Streptomyces termitum]